MTKILHISEEYGFNEWYAILSDERYEELKNQWKTLKGLNCLVPVRFLVPEAKNFPLRDEHKDYGDLEYLQKNKVQIVGSHIHQSDDSWLEDADYDIPESQNFEFKGKTYTEEEVNKIFHQYRDEEDKEFEELSKKHPEMFDRPHFYPESWNRLKEGGGVVKMEVDWVIKVEE